MIESKFKRGRERVREKVENVRKAAREVGKLLYTQTKTHTTKAEPARPEVGLGWRLGELGVYRDELERRLSLLVAKRGVGPVGEQESAQLCAALLGRLV